jgi:hypothetical protein
MCGDELFDGDVVAVRIVGPSDDPPASPIVGQGTLDCGAEFIVVYNGVYALAVDHVGQRRPRERGVEQQHVRTDLVGRRERLHEAAMVAAHDADGLRCPTLQGLQRRREGVASNVELLIAQRADLVDQGGAVRAPTCRGGDSDRR